MGYAIRDLICALLLRFGKPIPAHGCRRMALLALAFCRSSARRLASSVSNHC